MEQVEVVCVEEAGYHVGEYASGSTVRVVLARGAERVECDGILIWDEEDAEYCFDEWKELAEAGEEGYKYWTE